MYGWQIPPPKKPSKSRADLARERREKVASLIKQGLLKSERIKQALLKVPREDFIPEPYRDYAYLEVPLPLPGLAATISCPHSYPLFYEPLGLDQGHKFLEVGLGSGYGAAVAREVVGEEGQVVAMEIDPVTFKYAKPISKGRATEMLCWCWPTAAWAIPSCSPMTGSLSRPPVQISPRRCWSSLPLAEGSLRR